MGNIWGVAAGAFIVFMIQAVVLKQLSNLAEQLANAGLIPTEIAHINFVEYQYLLFGIALVIMMLRRPEGLFPSQVRRAELHEVVEPEVAAADIEAEAAIMDEPEGQV
jgi:branched-chain amino acid transport system permease protein